MQSITEKSQDFSQKKRYLKLSNGVELIITSPKLGWYYDFLIPRLNIAQLAGIGAEMKQAIKEQVKEGNVSAKTLSALPKPMLDLMLAVVAYYIPDSVYEDISNPLDKDKLFDYKMKYCKLELEIVDALAIINALLEVADASRIVGFFDKIGRVMSTSKMKTRP